jgi:hypothetical protein
VNLERVDPPRRFTVGRADVIEIADCGRIDLDADEQVTFVTEAGGEYDVVRKSWGFYATPSLNDRLPRHGLRPVLVRDGGRKRFVLLVEQEREDDFEQYRCRQGLEIESWLDDAGPACLCGATLETVHVYDAPPPGETQFDADGPYRRELRRCGRCGHFRSIGGPDLERFYQGSYVDATYGDDGLRRAFERVVSLDAAESDNVGRVERILAFMADRPVGGPPTLLDVGAGLGVFPHAMKRRGWRCTALDPDARACAHARTVVGVEAIEADFMACEDRRRFDLVTFNKVLEHVVDPVAMLARAREFTGSGGLVYVELPDGEAAFADGPGREEFFIEHHHAFSMASMVLLARKADLGVVAAESLREPSGKYTLRAFMTTC